MPASPDAGPRLDASAPAASVLAGPQDFVTRPSGLARGVWEGPPWLFVVVPIALVLLGLGFVVRRIGLARLRRLLGRERG